MRNAINALLSAGVIALCIIAIYTLCYQPYQCNRITRTIKAQTLAAWDYDRRAPEGWRTVVGARRRLEAIEPCLTAWITDVEPYMVAAVNARLLKHFEQAATLYRKALDYDQRPEIYFNLGVTEVAAGQRERGIEDLVLAGRTGSYWNLIEDESLRNEVTRRLFYVPPPRF